MRVGFVVGEFPLLSETFVADQMAGLLARGFDVEVVCDRTKGDDRIDRQSEPMATLVDCGSGMTGPKAATYRIYISLLTSIATDGKGGTTVQTTFVPMGQDISAGSADRIPCGSTGRLEANFLDRINKTLVK